MYGNIDFKKDTKRQTKTLYIHIQYTTYPYTIQFIPRNRKREREIRIRLTTLSGPRGLIAISRILRVRYKPIIPVSDQKTEPYEIIGGGGGAL